MKTTVEDSNMETTAVKKKDTDKVAAIKERFGKENKVELIYDKKRKLMTVIITGYLNMSGGLFHCLKFLIELFGGDNVDMPNHYSVDGCPTCNYGGYDVWEFVVENVSKP